MLHKSSVGEPPLPRIVLAQTLDKIFPAFEEAEIDRTPRVAIVPGPHLRQRRDQTVVTVRSKHVVSSVAGKRDGHVLFHEPRQPERRDDTRKRLIQMTDNGR